MKCYQVLFFVVLFVLPVSMLASFTEVSGLGIGSTYCVCAGYANADSLIDFVTVNSGQTNYLYINTGSGFTETTPFIGANIAGCVAWADFDNDGDMDIAEGNNYGSQDYLYINDGDGNFTRVAAFGAARWTASMAWADCDNDGDLDLACGTEQTPNSNPCENYLYVNNGDGTFTEYQRFGDMDTRTVAWFDVDQDGDQDLIACNNAQPSYLYINEGNYSFSEAFNFGDHHTISYAIGDLDNDGDFDLVNANWNGYDYRFINNGNSTFTQQQFGPTAMGEWHSYAASIADCDNDGDLDYSVLVYASGGFTGQNYLYLNNGSGSFTRTEEFGDGYTRSGAWADIDRDGDLDLAIGRPNANCIYFNNANDSGTDLYLSLRLEGKFHESGSGFSNRNGIGALVTVYEQGFVGDPVYRLGLRQVEAYGGIGGQNSIDIEYGLPNDEFVDIQVIWPGSDGTQLVENWLSVQRGQFLTLHEGSGVAVEDNTFNPILTSCLLSIRPNPSYGLATIEFQLTVPSNVELNLYDLSGRSVREIVTGEFNSGHHSVQVSELPSGIYICQIKTESITDSVKLLVF